MLRPRATPTAAAVAVTAAGMLPVYLLGGLSVQVREDFDVGRSGVGSLVAAFFLAAAGGSLLGGRYADRLGPSRVMRCGAAASALCLLLAASAPSPVVLGAALALGGLASGAGQPASNALIGRAVDPPRRGRAYGLKQAAIPLGVLLGGLSVPLFGVTVGWRWAFVTGAALATAAAVTVPGPGPRQDEESGLRPAVRAQREASGGPYRLAPLVVLAVGATAGAAVGNAFGAFYVDSAVTAGLAPSLAGLSAAAGSALGIASRVGIGVLADLRAARWLVVVAAMMSAGALAAGLMASGDVRLLLPAVALAYGIGWAWAGLFTYAVSVTHPDAPGRATGITQAGVAVGGAGGPLLFGLLVDRSSLAIGWWVTAGLALVASAAVLAGRALLVRDRPALRTWLADR